MADLRLGTVEARFADIIWENEPLTTKALKWKRTTTYTVLKKLCDRGIFVTKDSVITAVVSKDAFHAIRSEQFAQGNFQGSLPAFLAAFTSRQTLTPEELAEIKKLIDSMGEMPF